MGADDRGLLREPRAGAAALTIPASRARNLLLIAFLVIVIAIERRAAISLGKLAGRRRSPAPVALQDLGGAFSAASPRRPWSNWRFRLDHTLRAGKPP